jgi:hypothetical protein
MPQNQDQNPSKETVSQSQDTAKPESLTRSGTREKGPRKVAKTMLFNKTEAKATEETEAPTRRTVAKTLLFKTDFVPNITKHIAEETTGQLERVRESYLDENLTASQTAPSTAAQQAKEEKARKVKKTLMEAKTGDLLASPESRTLPEAEEKPAKLEKPRKVKKTLMEAEIGDLLASPESLTDSTGTMQAGTAIPDQQFTSGAHTQLQTASQQETPAHSQLEAPSQQEAPAQTQEQTQTQPIAKRYVAKTRLDHSILYDTVIKAAEKLEHQATEQAKQKALEPVKPFVPVEAKKKALPCHWSWNDPEPCEKFQYCGICQTPIYSFHDMELPEAEALIFQRENLKKPTLYKRHDGKFMTRDCPIAVKRRKDTITYTLLGLAVTAAVIFVLATLPPPAKPPTPVITETAPPPPSTPTTTAQPNGNAQQGTAGDGSFHYERGQTMPQPIVAPTPEPAAPPPPTRQEETGEFWQFPAGQNQ